MNAYLKFFAQLTATVLAALAAALFGDNHLSANEGVNILILALGAVAVLGGGTLTAGVWKYTKSIVSAATAAAVILQSAIVSDGVSTTEWMQMIIAAFGTLGVFAVSGPVVQSVGRRATARRQ